MIASLLAALVGAAIPVALLALFVRWRIATQVKQASVRVSPYAVEVRRKKAARPSQLAWIRSTFGSRPATTLVARSQEEESPAERVCPRCRFVIVGGAAFCRRCGKRLYEP